jgi:phosphate acetyltransferase
MAKAILVVPTGRGVGLTSIALGLVHALDRQGVPVGFCKPITQLHASDTGPERSTRLVRQFSSLDPPEPLSRTETAQLFDEGGEDQLLEEVVARYEQAAKGMSVVVVEGLVSTEQLPNAATANGRIATSLDADVIVVASPGNDTPEQFASAVERATQPYGGLESERMIGCVLNGLNMPVDQRGHLRFDFGPGEDQEKYTEAEFRDACATHWPASFQLLGCIPWRRDLIALRVRDIVRYSNAWVLNEGQLDRRVTHVALGARSIRNLCESFRPGVLIITPGDRDDLLLAASMAALGGTHIAALMLTGGLQPSPCAMKLCQPGFDTGLPVLSVELDGMRIVLSIPGMNFEVPLDDKDRIQRVVQAVASRLSLDWLSELLQRTEERRLSPPAFRHQLVELAHRANKRIVLPEGDEPRTIAAAIICKQRGIARCVLLGDPVKIRHVAVLQGLKLPDDLEIIDPASVRGRYIGPMAKLRAAKGMTPAMAEESLQDNVVVGTMMLAAHEVDGLVSGAVHTTANTIRPALQLIKTAPGAKLVSSIFFMCLPEQVLVYGDCAVNPNPNAEELADIAIQSAASAKAFGIMPRVAMLSYSTGVSGSGSDVEKVAQATRIARERNPDLLIDGPLQYDAAAIADVARAKAPDSKVAGRATVFVFPDLNTGNTTYKAVQRSAHVISIGPMLQGLRKPVNDLSRGALVEDIVFTIALTAIQAEQEKGVSG